MKNKKNTKEDLSLERDSIADIELDKVLHQPIRTKIMAYLVDRGQADYNTIKKTFVLSDGHMSTHMKELVENDYLEVQKSFVENKPKTTYIVSDKGKKAFSSYVAALKKILTESNL
jgi:predicted ArsR family transcriptional regulator